MKSSSQRFLRLYNSIILCGFLNFLFSQFQVSPMVIENHLKNNESSITTIEIVNNGDSPLKLSIYLKDKAYIDGKEAEVLPGTFERSASEWIYFTPSVLNLDANESSSIRIKSVSVSPTFMPILFILFVRKSLDIF